MKKSFFLFAMLSSFAIAVPIALPAIPSAVSALKVTLGATAATVGALGTDKAMKVLSSDSNSARVAKYDMTIRNDVTGQTVDATVAGIVTRSTGLDALRKNYGSSGLGETATPSQLSKVLFPENKEAQKEAETRLSGIMQNDWTPMPHQESMDKATKGQDTYCYARSSSAVVYADTCDAACTALGGHRRGNACFQSPTSNFTYGSGRISTRPYPAPTTPDCYYNSKLSAATCSPSIVAQTTTTAGAAVDEFGSTAPMSLISQAVPRSEAQTVPTTIPVGDKYVTVTNNIITVSNTAAQAKAAEENPPAAPTEEMPDAPNIDFQTVEPSGEFKEYVNFGAECLQFDSIQFGKLSFKVDTRLLCQTVEGVGTATVAAASLIALAILRK